MAKLTARQKENARGVSHEDRADYDARRDAWLANEGIKTLRFSTTEIRDFVGDAVEKILKECILRTGRQPVPSACGDQVPCLPVNKQSSPPPCPPPPPILW
jgi:hypothetical protein